MPAYTITPPSPWATRSTTLTSAKRREHLSKVPDAINCEHFPTQVGYDDELQSGRDPDKDDEHADELP